MATSILETFKDVVPTSDMKDTEREEKVKAILALIGCAERAERWEDMCVLLKAYIGYKSKIKSAITDDEMNLLSVGYKNLVGVLRASQRTVASNDSETLDTLDAAMESEAKIELNSKYEKLVVEELNLKCDEILNILKKQLLPIVEPVSKKEQKKEDENKDEKKKDTKDNSIHQHVFYLKMAGDYYRYKAEIKTDKKSNDDAMAAEYYDNAMKIAKKYLQSTSPTRLGLFLNASVCQFEIMKNKKKACELAKAAFDDAIAKLDSLNDASYKDSTLIMQLLRDNLTLWTSDENKDDETQED